MPVPTETFRDQRKLHLLFAAFALLLLVATVWLVMEDYTRQWRSYQREARTWQTAMTEDAQAQAITAEMQRELDRLNDKIANLKASMPVEEIEALEAKRRRKQKELERRELPADAIEGHIGPLEQRLERAIVAHGEGSEEVRAIRDELANVRRQFRGKRAEIVTLESEIEQLAQKIDRHTDRIEDLERQIANLTREKQGLEDKLEELDPSGLAKLGQELRNAPLLDWFNPTEKPRQVFVPDVRNDLNFLTVDTVDRCHTCHVNIDDPAFEETNLLLFAERQLASHEKQDVAALDHPVVMLDFWEEAIEQAGGRLLEDRAAAREAALAAINTRYREAGRQPLEKAEALPEAFERIQSMDRRTAEPDLATWYQPLNDYLAALKHALRDRLGEEAFRALRDQYRYALIERYNAHREEAGNPPLEADRVLLGHPKIERFVGPESTHPMKSMGCTVCHLGSGQETDFQHAAHTPREIWVDAETGAEVPRFTLQEDHGRQDPHEHEAAGEPEVARAGFGGFDPAGAAPVLGAASGEAAPGRGDAPSKEAGWIQEGTNLANSGGDPAPYAPRREPEQHHARYLAPGRDAPRRAVRQADYWEKKYGWHRMAFMHWERPMHSLEFVEASCKRCHTEIMDIRESAPKLYEGRELFTRVGCADCHNISSMEGVPDVEQPSGPSLVHVDQKLSPEMAASWIWAPKAFRPTTRMPHFFMLENNAAPVDILRTRTEVAAMTWYLMNAEPEAGYYQAQGQAPPRYEPETPPEAPGSASRGKRLFEEVGCLACHTNLEEEGKAWITEDLQFRFGLEEEAAAERYAAMDYNARHTYAKTHLEEKLAEIGPELSGVGTKLRAGRSEAEARQWVYNWVRNPQHYSSTSIMPSFRLSEREANDLAAYLLSLERPGYEPAAFYEVEGGTPRLADPDGDRMLDALVAELKRGSMPSSQAEQEAAAMGAGEKMMFLGERMIQHYNCNACHLINGFEGRDSTAPNLDDWAAKDPGLLAFEYFYPAFDEERRTPNPSWRVKHEGLAADAPHIGPGDHGPADDSEATITRELVKWEKIEKTRQGWAYHKLHNPRVYERGKGALTRAEEVMEGGTIELDSPYERIKMPKLFLSDRQVRSLVTFLSSLRPTQVTESMQAKTVDEATERLIRGRQLDLVYNCSACHNIEGDHPHIWQHYDLYRPDGSIDFDKRNDAPPRLVGQGAKTSPGWLRQFLTDVFPIRPWLKVRMPSYHYDEGHADGLVAYFAGWSEVHAEKLAEWIGPVEELIAEREDLESWWTHPSVERQARKLREFAVQIQLHRPEDFDARRYSEAELAETWDGVLAKAKFLRGLWDIDYPFDKTPRPDIPDEAFARGEALFNELRCYQCHALGEQQTLTRLWELEQEALGGSSGGGDGDGAGADPYGGEDPYGEDAYAEEDPYGEAESDPYGEEAPYGEADEDPYGEEDPYGAETANEDAGGEAVTDAVETRFPEFMTRFTAPNISLAERRLQWNWVKQWLQEPAVIQPGTAMPQWFPGPVTSPENHPRSAFARYPEEAKRKAHAMYGHTGEQQIRYLMDFMYAAGYRNYTPDAEKLYGVEEEEAELSALEGPAAAAEEEAAPTDAGAEAGEGDGGEAEKAGEAGERAAGEQEAAAAPAVELHEEAEIAWDGTRVIGELTFAPGPVRRRPIRMATDRYCQKAHGDRPALSRSLVTGENGELKNVLIHVVEGLADRDWPVPEEPAVLDQVNCLYRPRVQGIMAGQPLTILNSDDTLHNVKGSSSRNGAFNEGMPVKGMSLQKQFKNPELGIVFRCDVHPWMSASMHVFDHPFFAVTDAGGAFEITGLPPGTYTLEARHESERIPARRFEIEVKEDRSVRRDLELAPE